MKFLLALMTLTTLTLLDHSAMAVSHPSHNFNCADERREATAAKRLELATEAVSKIEQMFKIECEAVRERVFVTHSIRFQCNNDTKISVRLKSPFCRPDFVEVVRIRIIK